MVLVRLTKHPRGLAPRTVQKVIIRHTVHKESFRTIAWELPGCHWAPWGTVPCEWGTERMPRNRRQNHRGPLDLEKAWPSICSTSQDALGRILKVGPCDLHGRPRIEVSLVQYLA